MKKSTLFSAVVMMLLGTACSNSELEQMVNNEPLELRLSSSIDVQTRASSNTQATQFVNGEKVYAWLDNKAEKQSATVVSDYIKAWTLTAATNAGEGGSNFTGSSQHWPTNGNKFVDVYAIHGNFDETLTEGTTGFPGTLNHRVKEDQTQIADYQVSDLVYGKATDQERSLSPISVTFKHQLSKVEIALKAGNGLSFSDLSTAVKSVKILGTKVAATVTTSKTADLTLQLTGDAKPITVAQAFSNVADWTNDADVKYNEVIILPQTVGASSTEKANFIEIELNDGGKLYFKTYQTFAAGKKYIYKISLSLTELSVTSSITDWEDANIGNDGIGDATMD